MRSQTYGHTCHSPAKNTEMRFDICEQAHSQIEYIAEVIGGSALNSDKKGVVIV